MLTDLNTLAAHWLNAKQAEEAAREKRVAIERDIVAMTGAREEGAETHKTDRYAIAVTGKLNRTLDLDLWHAIVEQVPAALRPIKVKEELDEKGVKWLRDNDPEIYAIVAQAITTKPAKTAVTVKPIEQKAA